MQTINSGFLADGRTYEILRIVTPDDATSVEVVRYFMASLGYEKYRNVVQDIAYWRLYFRESLAGNLAPEVIDHHYLCRVDGQFAGRLWFGYAPRTGHGNFGNVFTEPEFRRLGVMTLLLKHFVADFKASEAQMLCCASGNEFAVRCYCDCGFQLIYGGKSGPLCLCKQGPFAEMERKCYDEPAGWTVRPGTIGDQFDCDKFLAYTSAMWEQDRPRFGIGALVADYRCAYQEVLSGHGVVKVLENTCGALCGYAFALRLSGQDILDFRVHPKWSEGLPELLAQTSDDFAEHFGTRPVCIIPLEDAVSAMALKNAGRQTAGTLLGKWQAWQ